MKPIAILAISVLISIPATLHAQTKRIPVAYSAVSASQSSFYLTKEAGLFEKHGLYVDPVYVASGTKVAQAVIAGEFPVRLLKEALAIHEVRAVVANVADISTNLPYVERPAVGLHHVGRKLGR